MRVGILTGGGDCPGLNAVIRAVVRRAMLETVPAEGVGNKKGHVERIRATWERLALGALIVVGGEGTLRAARDMWHHHNYPVVGVPKTIDNDLDGTDFTFGFDTAVNTVMEAVDRLHSTAEALHRVMVVEVMGRHAGWIAAYGGIAGGADVILVPEHPFKLSRVCELLRHREEQGRAFSIVVVAEDAHPHPDEDFLGGELSERLYRHDRLGGIGSVLAHEIERCTGIETR